MGKFIAGILGSVIVGVVLWLLTNAVFPQWFAHPPPPPEDNTRVECSANPPTVSPGGVTEIMVKVTRGGEPIEGAAVSFTINGKLISGHTYSGGVFRTTWTAPSPSAGGYVFPVDIDLEGLRTAKRILQGHYHTNCEILVR